MGIAVDGSGNVNATSRSNATWGWPIRPYTPSGDDAFVVKFDTSGALLWNTFLGRLQRLGSRIRLGGDGNVYVAGMSLENWGSPTTPFHGNMDAFVAKLDPSGSILWNAFLGSPGPDLVTPWSWIRAAIPTSPAPASAPGGSPDRPYSAQWDAFAAKLDSAGNFLWNTFLGGTGYDYGQGICLDPSETSSSRARAPYLGLPDSCLFQEPGIARS